MTYYIETTYYVMDAETEETIAMTQKKDVAEWLKENYPTPVIVRPSFVKKVRH